MQLRLLQGVKKMRFELLLVLRSLRMKIERMMMKICSIVNCAQYALYILQLSSQFRTRTTLAVKHAMLQAICKLSAMNKS